MSTQMVLGEMKLERSGTMALHQQIRREIRHLIDRQRLQTGDRLPPHPELADILGVSKVTVTRALRALAAEGVLESSPGRGTFVAERRAVRTTEIIFWHTEPDPGTRLDSLVHQVTDGIVGGLHEEGRRFLTTFNRGDVLTGREIMGTARVRGADSIIAHQVSVGLARELTYAALELPCVSLGRAVPGSSLDAVTVNPDAALREMLLARLARGERHFAYLGPEAIQASNDPYYTYARMYRVLRDTLRGAGVSPEMVVNSIAGSVPAPQSPEANAEEARLRARAASLPEGTVVLAHTPAHGDWALRQNQGLDVITFTSSRDTLAAMRGKMSFAYLGGDELGRAGAELLREHMAVPRSGGKSVEIPAHIVERVTGRAGGPRD